MPNERNDRERMSGAPIFWRYSQTNSGGWFDDDLPRVLWVQAEAPREADARAEALGVYFDGVYAGRDCDCCGDRWYRVGAYDRYPIHPDARWGHAPQEDEPVHMEGGEVWTGARVRAAMEGL